MRYETPKVTILASAVRAIHGGEKGPNPPVDMSLVQTIGAYEADE